MNFLILNLSFLNYSRIRSIKWTTNKICLILFLIIDFGLILITHCWLSLGLLLLLRILSEHCLKHAIVRFKLQNWCYLFLFFFLLNLSIIILCSCLILWCLSFIFKLLLMLIIQLWFLICIVLTSLLFDYRLIELLRLLRLNSFIFLLFCCFILITLLLCLLILLPLFIIRCLKIFLKLLLMILLWTLKFFRLTIWFNIWILTHIYCIWDSIQCSLFLFWLLLINFLLVSLNFCFKFL